MKSIEREILINKIKFLTKTHDKKMKEYRKLHNLSEDCSGITRESVILASLVFKMRDYNITMKDIESNENS